uniref:Uncharacterized protein n=1 Tax=Burkholderia phage vB_BgluM-SURPRISE13 TaxID=3159457 RepID=A0AAU7PF42_9VIRU
MSNNKSTVLLNGIVKKTNFRYPAGFAGHWAANANGNNGLGPKINELIYRFYTSGRRVYRLPGLSSPITDMNPQTTELLCRRSIIYVKQFLLENPQKRGMSFTLLDGTPWSDIVPNELFGMDVIAISVFWNGDIPIIACILGPRKMIKTPSTWASSVIDASLNVVVFECNPDEDDFETVRKMRNAIFSSTNFQLLKNYGTAIVRAVEETIDQENEYPIAAANYLDDVVWYVERPHRHHHILQSKEFQDAIAGRSHDLIVQGFLTNHGNFVTRYRAMLMAIDNRMIVDTPEMSVGIAANGDKMFQPIEARMGGIIRQNDETGKGFRVCVVPLFSEDLF